MMNLDQLRQAALAKVQQIGQSFTNFTHQNPVPNTYIGGQINNQIQRIAPQVQNTFNSLGNSFNTGVQSFNKPVISPLPNTPVEKITDGMRNIVGETGKQIIQSIPSTIASMVRTNPVTQLTQQVAGIQNPSLQPEIQKQRLTDVYKTAQGVGLATTGIGTQAVGGGVNLALQGVINKMQGNPFLKDYAQNFAQGVMGNAPFGPIEKGVGFALNAAADIPYKPLQKLVSAIEMNKQPILIKDMSKNIPPSVWIDIGQRAITKGVQGAAEGAAFGAIQPLENGQTREQAIANSAAQFAILGALMQAGGDINTVKLKPIAENIGLAFKDAKDFFLGKGFIEKDGKFIRPRTPGMIGYESSVKLPDVKLESKPSTEVGATQMEAGGKKPVQAQTPQIPKEAKKPVTPLGVIPVYDQRMGAKVPQDQSLSVSQPTSDRLNSQEGSSTTIIPPKVKVKTQQLNVNNLNLTTAQKEEILSMQANKLKTKLGDKQIMEIASQVGIDTKSHTVDQTAKKIAEQLNLRRNVVSLESELSSLRQQGASQEAIITKLRQIDEASRISAEQGTDIARQLRARRIMANELDTPMQRIFKLLQNAGVNPDEYTKQAATVDFNNPQQVVSFYRNLVPAKASEWLDQLRYNSMLSSPNTHINNLFANLGNTGVIAPIEKTITGTLDFLSSPLRGGQRNQFASEGPAYIKGYVGKLHEASNKFADVMSGVSQSKNLDTRYIPVASEGVKGTIAKTLDYPMRLLEASDQFFTTLTAGGEEAALKLRQSKGVNVGDIKGLANDSAAYRLYRSELNDPKQGALLKGIDHLTGLIMKARNDKSWVGTIAKYTIPFVKTPMNILKQMIEYSPAGVATIPGAMNKTEQLSKAIMGTSAALGASMLLASGKTTWAEPTDPKKKAAFRSAGMQPYSVKIGDNWVAYSKLPPAISANLALVSAVHDGIENKHLTDSQGQAILTGLAKWGNFFADQSYLRSMGDLLAAVKGDPEKITSYFANYPQQLVPFRALQGWVARILDPYQRKVDTNASFLDKQMQQYMMNIPGLSQNVPARLDQFGQPIENQNRILNAFSPMRITTENQTGKDLYNQLQQTSKNNQLVNDYKKQLENPNSSTGTLAGKTTYSIDGKPTEGYTVGNKFVYTNEDGEQTSKKIADVIQGQYEYVNKVTSALMTTATNAGDSETWQKIAQIQLDNLQKQLQEPDIKELDKITIQNKIVSLQKRLNKGIGGKKAKKIQLKPVSKLQLKSYKNLQKIKLSSPPKIKMPQILPSFLTQAPQAPNFKAKVKFNV